jgi:hypothetical protein
MLMGVKLCVDECYQNYYLHFHQSVLRQIILHQDAYSLKACLMKAAFANMTQGKRSPLR